MLYFFYHRAFYVVIWPADILHFYGIYMLFTVLLIRSAPQHILMWAAAVILIYPFYFIGLIMKRDGILIPRVSRFLEIDGFLRNLFINGFHPVLPWVSFMLVGFGTASRFKKRSVFKESNLG